MLLLTACSSETGTKKEVEKQEGEEGKVEVDKGLLNVELNLPASFFEGEDIAEVVAEAKKEGIAEVKENDDGSLSYKMTKSKHKEMMVEMKESLLEYVDELKNDDEMSSIKDVTYKKSFADFTLVVDREAFENGFDGFAVLGLGMTGMYYQLFNGADLEKSKVTIHLKDDSTGDVYNSVIYPDALDEE